AAATTGVGDGSPADFHAGMLGFVREPRVEIPPIEVPPSAVGGKNERVLLKQGPSPGGARAKGFEGRAAQEPLPDAQFGQEPLGRWRQRLSNAEGRVITLLNEEHAQRGGAPLQRESRRATRR